MNVRINKWLDLLDRVGWTFVQGFAGALFVDNVIGRVDLGWKDKLILAASMAGGAAVKVVFAQRAGSDDLGAAVPGQVIEK